MATMDDCNIILSDRHGQYIPQLFCEDIEQKDCEKYSIKWEDVQCCQKGPGQDNEWYWEAWQAIIDNFLATDDNGRQWRIVQNGDLWEVPANLELPQDFWF